MKSIVFTSITAVSKLRYLEQFKMDVQFGFKCGKMQFTWEGTFQLSVERGGVGVGALKNKHLCLAQGLNH